MPSAVGSASEGLKKEKDLTRKGGEACFRLRYHESCRGEELCERVTATTASAVGVSEVLRGAVTALGVQGGHNQVIPSRCLKPFSGSLWIME